MTFHVGVSVLVTLTLLVTTCQPFASSPTAEMFRQFSVTFAENLDVIESQFEDILPSDFADDVRSRGGDLEKYASVATCTACLAIVDLGTYVNLNGLGYADVRDELIAVCETLFNVSNPQAPLMCPGILDNYAPHVLEVLRIKPTNNSREICELFNACAINNTAEGVRLASQPRLERPQLSNKRRPMSDIDRTRIRANSLRVVHLTDIHVEHSYLEGSATDCGLIVCCMGEYPGEGAADPWGEYKCNAPPRTTQLFFQKIGELITPADFIIYTGDSPPHTTWLETQAGQLEAATWVAETMHAMLPTATAYVTMGNHENYPSNLYYIDRPETQELNREFFRAWQPLAKWTAAQEETILYAGYYTMLARPGLRILSFNTNFGYTFNWYNWINIDRQEYWDTINFVNDTLYRAKSVGEKVVLIVHHPTAHGDCMIEWGQFITDMLLTYQDTIVLHVMGHTHRDEFHLAIDPKDGIAKGMQYVSGTANTYSFVNPSARLFYLDPVTFQVLDYDHYILDIEPAPSATANLTLAYSASEEYQLTDLSPESWKDLTYRMEDDDQLFEKYIDNLYARSGNNECNALCRRDELCRMRSSSIDQFDACVENSGPGPGPGRY